MSLNKRFINAMSRRSYKTNVAVVFSPKDNFYSSVNVSTPFGNAAYNGSQSYIFWKREPDITRRDDLFDIEQHFKAFLSGNLTSSDIPLSCIDSVSIAGGELDVKDAAVQDDGVSINIVLDNARHKNFFQNLIGYNVEIYLGFSGQGFDFFDYERFYIGKLNGLSSPSNLSLQLKVGTLVDYWNKTWVHSQNLRPTQTAYPYPLFEENKVHTRWNDAAYNTKDGDFDNDIPAINGRTLTSPTDRPSPQGTVPFRFESDLYRAIKNVENFTFDYEYNYPRWRDPAFVGGPPITPLPDDSLGRRPTDRDLKAWSAVFFIPSGNRYHIHRVSPESIDLSQTYPEVDQDFLNARLSPTAKNRIRFRMSDVVFESEYIDVYVFWPLVFVPNNTLQGTVVSGVRSFIFDVERMPDNPEAAQNADVHTLNALTPFSQSDSHYQLDGTVLHGRYFPNFQPTYENLYYRAYCYLGINRLKFATKLRMFVDRTNEDGEQTMFNADSGTDVYFYDTKTGIGTLDEVLVNTLNQNLGININLIDQNSFTTARTKFESLMSVPAREGIPGSRGRSSSPANSDYCFDGQGDGKDHIETTILKSNNLRMYIDRGVLKCLFLQTRDSAVLQEDVNGEFVPFLISEDDILESTTYETRPEELVRRIKVNTGFRFPNSDTPQLSLYCVDNRNQDRTSGTIVVARSPGVGYSEDDFEEIDVRQNFTDSTRARNHLTGTTLGAIGSPYKRISDVNQALLVAVFANYYFDVVNPYIKLTVNTGARGLLVSVGDVIVLRDHQAFELFGSQFIKVFVINKSISDWGTENIRVTLDCLFIGKSTDYLEADRPTRPSNLRRTSLVASPRNEGALTRVGLTFDQPDDWGHEVNQDLFTYRLYETTPTGERFLASLPYRQNKTEGYLSWSAANRQITIDLNNDKTYHLFVRADNGAFEGPASNVLEVETLDSVVAPSAPLNLRITGSNRTHVDLAWSASTDLGRAPSVTYNIYVDGTYFINVGGQLGYSFNFEDRSAGEVVEFYITAQNDAGESVSSNVVRFIVPQPLPVPEGTIELSGVGISISQTRLTWSANITRGNVDVSYALHRSDNAASIGPVINESIVDSPIDDAGLQADTTYYYTIVARNESGEGVNSPRVAVKTLPRIVRTVPRAPSGFRIG